MKLVITTSNLYSHIIPVFEYLFKRHWNYSNVELVGYTKPDTNLPFHSLGEQGTVNEWSTDLRRYFQEQEDWFIWVMEDTIIKAFSEENFDICCAMMMPGIGRIGLTKDIQNRPHKVFEGGLVYAERDSRYRLSTQPSIWNKEFLLQYLTDGLNPWEFETIDPKNDGWDTATTKEPAIISNEGVRRQDIYKLDLNRICEEDLKEINKITSKW